LKNFSERPPLQWFKDDFDIIQSREIDKKEVQKKKQDESIIIEELKEELLDEKSKKDLTIEKNMNKELIIEETLQKDLIKENTNESLNIEKKLKEKSTIQENLEKILIEEHLKTELIDQTNLKEDTTLNKNIEKEIDARIKKTTTNLSKDFNFKECSSYSEDSELDDENTSSKSSTHSLVKEMDQKSLQKFCMKMKKPDQDLIDKILKGQYPKINQIFDEPTKAVPLPRRGGTINVTFSERAFPTPARESSFLEEQEVCVSSNVNSMINLFLLRESYKN